MQILTTIFIFAYVYMLFHEREKDAKEIDRLTNKCIDLENEIKRLKNNID